MKFNSNLSKNEFLDKLRRVTTVGSANMAVGPWFLLNYLLNGKNKRDFYGLVHSKGFDLTIIKGLRTYSISLNGRIKQENNQTIIETKFDFLVFPFLIALLFFIVLFGISIFTFFQGVEPKVSLGMIGVGIAILILIRFGLKREKRKLVHRFIEKTDAAILVPEIK